MAAIWARLAHVGQIVLSSYGAYQSYVAINNLQKYEETTKKLAKWSDEVANQLHKTRTTQASGAVAILASLLTSTLLTISGTSLPSWLRFGASPALLIGILFARSHIKNYWASGNGNTVGTRIPLPKMEDYNEAQRRTEELLKTLEWLQWSWVVGSVVELVGMFT